MREKYPTLFTTISFHIGGSIGQYRPLAVFSVPLVVEPHEAVDLYQRAVKEDRRFDLVLMDLVLRDGGTSGLRAAELIRETDPEARIVICSGYSGSKSVVRRMESLGLNGVVAKPFYMPRLMEAVRNMEA